MADRYFLDEPPDGDRAQLRGAEAHHLAQVMRAAPGDEVRLFDGRGMEYVARIESASRQQVALQILERHAIDREPTCRLTLAVALPKGDRQRWLVEKSVELGVARLIPLRTRFSVAEPVDAALARIERGVLEATKQCGRTRLMEVSSPLNWQALLAADFGAAPRLVAHPDLANATTHKLADFQAEREIVAAIGPEGGFSHEELAEAIQHGWQHLSLGPRILRIETAAAAIAAWFSQQ